MTSSTRLTCSVLSRSRSSCAFLRRSADLQGATSVSVVEAGQGRGEGEERDALLDLGVELVAGARQVGAELLEGVSVVGVLLLELIDAAHRTETESVGAPRWEREGEERTESSPA